MSRLERFYLASGGAVFAVTGSPSYATLPHGQLTTRQLVLDVATHVAGAIGWLVAALWGYWERA